MALMVSPVKPRVALVVGLFPPPGGVVPFVILVDALTVSGLLISFLVYLFPCCWSYGQVSGFFRADANRLFD
jgi:hypothetical protein